MLLSDGAELPPEVSLDRYVRTTLCKEPGCSGYIGKLDIDKVESTSFRDLLHLLHQSMNEALRLEGPNASGGVEHPPFHFDYIDVNDGSVNAHAFEHRDLAFIVVTLPAVELVVRLSLRLVPVVPGLLRLNPAIIEQDALWGLLSQICLNFLVAHEYSHHIHKHCGCLRGASGIWTESIGGATNGGMAVQAQELIADRYATLLVLAHLVGGERRTSALQVLGKDSHVSKLEGDESLIRCFLFVAMTFLCNFWPGDLSVDAIAGATHPPAPFRIQSLIRITEMWCKENGSMARSWSSPSELRAPFEAAAVTSENANAIEWANSLAAMQREAYFDYGERLFEALESLLRGPAAERS
jgi:hypothetical protein